MFVPGVCAPVRLPARSEFNRHRKNPEPFGSGFFSSPPPLTAVSLCGKMVKGAVSRYGILLDAADWFDWHSPFPFHDPPPQHIQQETPYEATYGQGPPHSGRPLSSSTQLSHSPETPVPGGIFYRYGSTTEASRARIMTITRISAITRVFRFILSPPP